MKPSDSSSASGPVSRQPLATQLVRDPNPLDRWLWCLHCERFFQVRHLRFDVCHIERCPFDDCTGAGLDQDLFLWDDWRAADDPRWPRSEAELEYGMYSPEIASIRDAANRETDELLARFERSEEFRRLRAGAGAPRWTSELLEKLAWWSTRPNEVDPGYLADTLRDFAFWFPCSPWDASDITRELCAFFDFAARELDWPHARACARYLSHPSVGLELGRCIKKERRRQRRSRG